MIIRLSVNIYFSPLNPIFITFAKYLITMNYINLAIFASGSGSNAENIVNYFANNKQIRVAALFCNKADAFVLERIYKTQFPKIVFTKNELLNSSKIDEKLQSFAIDYIVLAGFLLKIPKRINDLYKNKIINIHPALLPDFGGEGMYGMNVHKAVKSSGASETGITVHLIDEDYDRGETIFQAKCLVTPEDTPESIADKIHTLEQEHFPKVIERFILERSTL